MPKKRVIQIGVMIAFIAGLVLFAVYQQTIPRADVITNNQAATKQKERVVTGTVYDTNNKPLPNIVVTIGDLGVTTKSLGEYTLIVKEEGEIPVTFFNTQTRERYQLADTFHQTTHIDTEEEVVRDFIIKKVDGLSFSPQPSSLDRTRIAPAKLTGSAKKKPFQVVLKWQDKSKNENGFEIWRSESKTSDGQLLSDVDANKTTFNDITIASKKTYYYKIRSFRTEGNQRKYSNFSNVATVKVP